MKTVPVLLTLAVWLRLTIAWNITGQPQDVVWIRQALFLSIFVEMTVTETSQLQIDFSIFSIYIVLRLLSHFLNYTTNVKDYHK